MLRVDAVRPLVRELEDAVEELLLVDEAVGRGVEALKKLVDGRLDRIGVRGDAARGRALAGEGHQIHKHRADLGLQVDIYVYMFK